MRLLGILVGLAIALYLGVTFAYPSYTHRYRLMLEVETPDGLRTGSSVIEVSTRPIPRFLDPLFYASGAPKAKGEAIFIDLGQDRILVALLRFGPDAQAQHSMASLAFEAFQVPAATPDDLQRMSRRSGRADLPGYLIPTLVTFKNPADPKTVRVVSPAEFATVFGPGVRLRNAWIEMTRDGVATGIEQKLPWLKDMEQSGLGSTIRTKRGVFTINVPYFKERTSLDAFLQRAIA